MDINMVRDANIASETGFCHFIAVGIPPGPVHPLKYVNSTHSEYGIWQRHATRCPESIVEVAVQTSQWIDSLGVAYPWNESGKSSTITFISLPGRDVKELCQVEQWKKCNQHPFIGPLLLHILLTGMDSWQQQPISRVSFQFPEKLLVMPCIYHQTWNAILPLSL